MGASPAVLSPTSHAPRAASGSWGAPWALAGPRIANSASAADVPRDTARVGSRMGGVTYKQAPKAVCDDSVNGRVRFANFLRTAATFRKPEPSCAPSRVIGRRLFLALWAGGAAPLGWARLSRR